MEKATHEWREWTPPSTWAFVERSSKRTTPLATLSLKRIHINKDIYLFKKGVFGGDSPAGDHNYALLASQVNFPPKVIEFRKDIDIIRKSKKF